MSGLKNMAEALAHDIAEKVTADPREFHKLWVHAQTEHAMMLLMLGEAAGMSRKEINDVLSYYRVSLFQAFKAKITEEVLEQQKAAADALAAALQTRNQS